MHETIISMVHYADTYDEAYELQLAYQTFDAECNEATYAEALAAEDAFFAAVYAVFDADIASTTPA